MTAAGDTWAESIKVRPVTAGEIGSFIDVFESAWGFPPDDEQQRQTAAVVAAQTPLAAFADGAMAGTAMSFALELTVPGQVQLPMAGVSYVAVHPLRRRRGVMRALMRFQLDDLHARGVPLAGLGASEAGIYGRFGYGPATWASSWRLARGAARALAGSGDVGRLELVDGATAREVFPAVHDQARRTQVGDVRTYPGCSQGTAETGNRTTLCVSLPGQAASGSGQGPQDHDGTQVPHAFPGAAGGAGVAADAQDLGGALPVDAVGGATRTMRFSRRPWPFPGQSRW